MASAFWQTVVRFDATRLTPEIAFRNTVGIVAPLIAGVALRDPASAAVVALGALNVCYSDSREAYAVRARRMLLASLLVGLAVAVGALSARNNITAAIAAMVWAFGVGMLVVLGPKAADLGLVSLVTLIVFAAKQLTLKQALISGLLAFAGGLLQTLLSVAIWPVRPYAPERRIIAELYRTLGQIAVSAAGSGSPPPATSAVLDAGDALASLHADSPNEAERLVFLLNQAERIRLSVLTLRRLGRRLSRKPVSFPASQAVDQLLTLAAAMLRAIARQAETGDSPATLQNLHPTEDFGRAAREFQTADWSPPGTMSAAFIRDAKRQVSALAGQLRAAAGLTSRAIRPAQHPSAAPAGTGRRDRLKANLSLKSSAFRHAVRLSLSVGLAAALGHGLHLPRPYWIPMTVAIVLKPDFVSTFSRGILRVAGTLVGLLVATTAYYLLPDRLEIHVVLLAAFTVMLRWIGPANYGVFVTAVSGIIVLLMALIGVKPTDVVGPRAINTAIGGALALAGYWVWPTWERSQTATVLADMLDAYREYFQGVMCARGDAAVRRTPARHSLGAVRKAGRLARSNAEASVGRFLAEPGVTPERRTLLNEILISSHAFVRAAMAIESDPETTRYPAVTEAACNFAERGEQALQWMSAALRSSKPTGPFPNVREAWTQLDEATRAASHPHSLLVVEADRMATGLNTLREQIVRWLAFGI